MGTCPLCRREIIDTPPTHLQKDKRDDDHPESNTLLVMRVTAVMDIDEIGEPGDGSPCLFRIP